MPGILAQLYAIQMKPAFGLFDTEEIGHDDLDSLGPEVSPFLGEYNRDIIKLMQLSVVSINPIILPPAIGLVRGAAAIGRFGQVLD